MVQMALGASGTWGCGAWHSNSWLQINWDHRAESLSVAVKELIPIALASVVWGQTWHAYQVRCLYANQVVVATLQSRTSKDAGVMHLLRCLTFVEAQLDCHLYGAIH